MLSPGPPPCPRPRRRSRSCIPRDLLHPHDDPDDHYDLATLFALDEFDIRGIVLDLGERQAQRRGQPPVDQLREITGRRVPTAVGLNRPLSNRTDPATDVPAEFAGGVALILSVLRESPAPVTVFTTGSCRDVAAAFNREPDLLRKKVRALYCNVGRGPNERQDEWNVTLDPAAYLRLFESGLPLYWCPCFGKEGYGTLFVADQATVVGACGPAVQNFFVYCLQRAKDDPVAFLRAGPHPVPTGPRNMWCTAPLLHAAGRKIYARGTDDFVALAPAAAEQAGLASRAVDAFQFVPIRAHLDAPAVDKPSPPPEPAAGQLTAAYAGHAQDRVGTRDPQPDGRPDCQVRVRGVDPQAPIKNIVVTGPKEARWEYVETGRWWRLAYQRQGDQLDGFFQFWAAGPHRIEVQYESGRAASAEFQVPPVAPAEFRVELLTSAETGTFVFRTTEPRYPAILAACLKNLLAGLGR